MVFSIFTQNTVGMKLLKLTLLGILTLSFVFLISCNDDEGKKIGAGEVTITVNGTIEPDHKFLLTFSDLVGIQDYPNGVEVSTGESVELVFPRVGELLSIYLSNIPTNYGDVSSTSSTSSQVGFNDNPSDPDHPEAEYESIFLVPVDGSVGKLEFSLNCN